MAFRRMQQQCDLWLVMIVWAHSFIVVETTSSVAAAFTTTVPHARPQTKAHDQYQLCHPVRRRRRPSLLLTSSRNDDATSTGQQQTVLDSTNPVSFLEPNEEWETFLKDLGMYGRFGVGRTSNAACSYASSPVESAAAAAAAAGGLQDPLWEQIRLEAVHAVQPEPEVGVQLYQALLSQPSLLDALITRVSHEIESELLKATQIKNLFLELLEPEDDVAIHFDVLAAAMRSPSVGTAMTATLFQSGLHALVCYRLGHRLWLAGRTGLAYFMQSTVSAKYSADIHPAAQIASGIYLKCQGVVIGETAMVGQDVSILQGVTLGGTGKESGDRHPKVHRGVILQNDATVLGNIIVGEGSVITARSIVTKPVAPLSVMTGVPAKFQHYRDLEESQFGQSDLEMDLAFKYKDEWSSLLEERKLADAKEREQQEQASK